MTLHGKNKCHFQITPILMYFTLENELWKNDFRRHYVVVFLLCDAMWQSYGDFRIQRLKLRQSDHF